MRVLLVFGTAAVASVLLAVNALAPTAAGGCPDTGDRVGRPIAKPAERALIGSTFSRRTIDACWPGTPR